MNKEKNQIFKSLLLSCIKGELSFKVTSDSLISGDPVLQIDKVPHCIALYDKRGLLFRISSHFCAYGEAYEYEPHKWKFYTAIAIGYDASFYFEFSKKE